MGRMKIKVSTVIVLIITIILGIAVGLGIVHFITADGIDETAAETEDESGTVEENEADSEDESGTTEEVSSDLEQNDEENESDSSEGEEAKDWRRLYIEYLSDQNNSGMLNGFPYYGFLYVDDDDIPEIAIMGDCEAAGNRFLTCKNGVVEEIYFARLGFSFQERKNIIINSDGHSGYYYDTVYEIDENGKWKIIGDGVYVEDYANMTENEDIPMNYTWDGREMSADEYYVELGRFYDAKSSLSLDTFACTYPDYDEIIDLLETGNTFSSETASRYFTDDTAIHGYEIVVDDVNWWNAKTNSIEKGGHLVRINSIEEYNYIVDLIKERGLEKKLFWTAGAKAFPDNSYRWINSDYKYELTDLTTDPELSTLWMEGEPSGSGKTEDGSVVEEEYVVLFYLKRENRFVFNDVPDDLISAAPSYKGNVAYIIEYE